MKRQIRCGVFETNSSSVHSITMCVDSEFNKWKNGEVLFWREADIFGTKEDFIKQLKEEKNYNDSFQYGDVDWNDSEEVDEIFNDEGIMSYDKFFDDDWYETYCHEYNTPGGERVVAFGYYGHD